MGADEVDNPRKPKERVVLLVGDPVGCSNRNEDVSHVVAL